VKAYFALRAYALLLKTNTHLTSIATSLETLAHIETERWQKENVRPPVQKKMTFGTLNVDQANKEWKRRVEGRARDES